MAEKKRSGSGGWKIRLTAVEINDLVAIGMVGTLVCGLIIVLAMPEATQAVSLWLGNKWVNLVLR